MTLDALKARGPLRVAVIGLGVGTLAAYTRARAMNIPFTRMTLPSSMSQDIFSGYWMVRPGRCE